MATGRTMQLTKIIGEYLICPGLCRTGLLATAFIGDVPESDILATDKRLQYETQSELDALVPSVLAKAVREELLRNWMSEIELRGGQLWKRLRKRICRKKI